jgi:hypothetical protein
MSKQSRFDGIMRHVIKVTPAQLRAQMAKSKEAKELAKRDLEAKGQNLNRA